MEGTEEEWRVKDFYIRLDLFNKHSATLVKGAKHCESCQFVDRKLRHLRTKMWKRFQREQEEPIDRFETEILIAEVLRETEDEVIGEVEEEEVKKGYVLPTPPKKMKKKALREIGNVGDYDQSDASRYGDKYESSDEEDSDKSDKEESSSDSERDSDKDSDKEEEEGDKEEEDDKKEGEMVDEQLD